MNGDVPNRTPDQQNRFLTWDSPEAYVDHPTPEDRLTYYRQQFPNATPLRCPKCKGYGGHNLEVNAYPLRKGMADTAENRHQFCHFRRSCDQCVGWGYVTDKRDAECVHEAGPGTATNFRCVTNYRCIKCGKGWSVDSSD